MRPVRGEKELTEHVAVEGQRGSEREERDRERERERKLSHSILDMQIMCVMRKSIVVVAVAIGKIICYAYVVCSGVMIWL